MTDRERLLEQVREAEDRAWEWAERWRKWICLGSSEDVCLKARNQLVHHALTAMALRDAIDQIDELCAFCVWPDAAE